MRLFAILNRTSSSSNLFSAGYWDGAAAEILRATRAWIQFGAVAFAIVCIVIGAVEGLVGR